LVKQYRKDVDTSYRYGSADPFIKTTDPDPDPGVKIIIEPPDSDPKHHLRSRLIGSCNSASVRSSEIYLEIIRIKSQSLTAAGAGLFRPLQHQAAFRLKAQLIGKIVTCP
jgi:hypothetical protein